MGHYRTTVILKTDIVNSTLRLSALTQAEMGLQRKQHKQFIAETAIQHRGSVFDEEGDGYWIEFPSVTDAVLTAIDMHQALRTMQAGKGEKKRLAIRAVVTVGDILHHEKETIGMTMSLTARIANITPPDEIYLSHAAWLVLNKAEVQTSLVGKFNMKGFDEPEEIFKVDQSFRTRVITDQCIVFTDAKGFTSFVKSNSVEEIENFLLDCDDLINDICDRYGGIIRSVNGDQYFLTFTEAAQTLNAVETLCRNWKKVVERYRIGLSIGVHKGDLNVIRSYVYGDDIHTTVYLRQIEKLYHLKRDEIFVVTSGRIRDEFKGTEHEIKFRELDIDRLTQEIHRIVASEHGVYQLIVE